MNNKIYKKNKTIYKMNNKIYIKNKTIYKKNKYKHSSLSNKNYILIMCF